jgi:hypothetical protein
MQKLLYCCASYRIRTDNSESSIQRNTIVPKDAFCDFEWYAILSLKPYYFRNLIAYMSHNSNE